LLAHGRWFSPGTPASSTTKTGRSNLVVSKIPLCSTNYVNNRHRLIWTLCKKYIQIGWKSKSFKILEIWTFRSLSVKFISETVKDTGNPSTYCRKLSIQFFNAFLKKIPFRTMHSVII
jgi:hypothetical protein